MAFADDLLQLAQRLAELRPENQASLRRAVSTAYYALFHLLISEATANWSRPELRATLGRCFDHGPMRTASEAKISQINAAIKNKTIGGVEKEVALQLSTVANAFVQAQQERNDADYNMAKAWTRVDVDEHIASVSEAFKTWNLIRHQDVAQAYLRVERTNGHCNSSHSPGPRAQQFDTPGTRSCRARTLLAETRHWSYVRSPDLHSARGWNQGAQTPIGRAHRNPGKVYAESAGFTSPRQRDEMIANIDTGTALAIAVPSVTVLIGILLNQAGLSNLRSEMSGRLVSLGNRMDARFDDMDKLFTERLLRVEQVMDARLTNLERRLGER